MEEEDCACWRRRIARVGGRIARVGGGALVVLLLDELLWQTCDAVCGGTAWRGADGRLFHDVVVLFAMDRLVKGPSMCFGEGRGGIWRMWGTRTEGLGPRVAKVVCGPGANLLEIKLSVNL